MGDINRNTHVGKVEAVAQTDKRERNDVMENQLFEVLARLFQLQNKNDGLLGPVRRLQQIICFEDALVLAMRKPFKHRSRIEVPQRALLHHIQTKGTENPKVYCGIGLLHEARLLGSFGDSIPYGQGTEDALHHKLPREREEDGVEADKGEIGLAFPIHVRAAGVGWAERIRKEDALVKRILRTWADVVGSDDCDQEDERVQPGVSQGDLNPLAKCRSRFPSFRVRLEAFLVCLRPVRLGAVLSQGSRTDICPLGRSDMVASAGTPVSPRGSPPRLLEVRRGRPMMAAVM